MKQLIMIFIFIFATSMLSAAIYKGHRIYVKECGSCHTNKEGFLKTKTASQWESLMKNKGKPLKEIHIKDAKAKKSLKYFNSAKYTKKSKHLKEFLMEYAKDKDKVPAFN